MENLSQLLALTELSRLLQSRLAHSKLQGLDTPLAMPIVLVPQVQQWPLQPLPTKPTVSILPSALPSKPFAFARELEPFISKIHLLNQKIEAVKVAESRPTKYIKPHVHKAASKTDSEEILKEIVRNFLS